jgi:hypothetical protein
MTGTIWIPEAERLGDGSIGGAMDTPDRKPRVTWHTTESGDGNAAFDAVARYLIAETYEPHILYDPRTDRLGQFGPLNQSARALQNWGDVRTNRTGLVNIQIEVLAHAATAFTGYWKPGPNFRALMKAIRSWGVPDVFPLPLATSASFCVRTASVWLAEAGHYGHCNTPGNSHWDPGHLDTVKLFAAAPVAVPKPPAPKPTPAPKPVVYLSRIVAARKADLPAATGHKTHPADVKIVEAALHAEGLLDSKYVDGSWGSMTDAAYHNFRIKMKYTGAAADGDPGMESLSLLAKRHGFTVKAKP